MGVKAQEITGNKTKDPIAKVNSLSAEQILKGIAKFKKVTPLTKNKAPQYSDESTTIYLYLPSSAVSGDDGYLVLINVPHPLSFNRRVCLFLKDKASEEYHAPSIATMKEMGIQDIKVVLRSEVESAINENATESLEEIVKTYDTLLADNKCSSLIRFTIRSILNANGKTVGNCNIQVLKGQMALFVKPSLGGYTIKIGHTGFSEEQLLENIQAALTGVMSRERWFPQGLNHFKAVTLKTGTTPGVAIYTNKGEIVPEPMKEIHSEPVGPKRKAKSQTLRNRKRNAEKKIKKQKTINAAKAVVKEATVVMTTESPAGKKKKNKDQKAAVIPVQSGVQLSTVGKKMKIKKQKAAASPVQSVDQVFPTGKKLKSKKQKAAVIPVQSGVQLSTVGKKMKIMKQNAAASPVQSVDQVSPTGKKLKSKKKQQKVAAAAC